MHGRPWRQQRHSLYDALDRIAEEVFRDAPSEEYRGRRAFVALTDGVDSTSNTEFETARRKLVRAGVASYFIQVNTEEFVENGILKDCGEGLALSPKQLQRYRRMFHPRADASDFSDFCQMGSFERMTISRDLYNLARREMNELAKASGGKNFLANTLQDARAALRVSQQRSGPNTVWAITRQTRRATASFRASGRGSGRAGQAAGPRREGSTPRRGEIRARRPGTPGRN